MAENGNVRWAWLSKYGFPLVSGVTAIGSVLVAVVLYGATLKGDIALTNARIDLQAVKIEQLRENDASLAATLREVRVCLDQLRNDASTFQLASTADRAKLSSEVIGLTKSVDNLVRVMRAAFVLIRLDVDTANLAERYKKHTKGLEDNE